ncbi:MAG: heparan-alpha-glucosaminide N-acetyltransferase domain-containing protein, partial [Candidatus Aenigmarchaeota archaeon]|nr:heparan-alpha-glucosaminide N-acetyltransferase domain-containing protein [Candidatus Aenigmarchaeota archaeon]
TWLFFPAYTVLFGILHLIGISIILSVSFLKKKKLILPTFLSIVIIGFYLESYNLNFSLFFWLMPQNFQTFDYFPVLPWFGAVLLGAFVGSKLYEDGKRKYKIVDSPRIAKPINFLGRHSLLIYLLHQPLLLVIFYMF